MKTRKLILKYGIFLISFLVLLLSFNNLAYSAEEKGKIGRTEWNKAGDTLYTSLGSPYKADKAKEDILQVSGSLKETGEDCSHQTFFKEPICKKKDGYHSISLPGLDTWYGTPGAPQIPVKTVRLLIPYGQEAVRVKVIPGPTQEIEGKYLLEPTQKPVPISQLDKAELTLPDPEIYKSDNLYPSIPCGDAFIQRKRGYTILIVNLFPVEYRPKSRRIFYRPYMKVEVETASGQKTLLAQGINAVASIKVDHNIADEIQSIVDNPEAIKTYKKEVKAQALQAPLLSYEYVIITTNTLKSASGTYTLWDLLSAKEARGVTTKLVTVEDDVYPYYTGTDNQEKIRNFIIDYYNNYGTQYVLLVGQGSKGFEPNTYIPPRLFWVQSWPPPENREDTMPVDMYYGCLDGNFNNDGDGLYGEPTDGPGGGEVDLFAEVYVGRAPVETATEISNFVEKTLTYENSRINLSLPNAYMVGEYLWPNTYGKDYMLEIRDGSNTNGHTTVGFENSAYANFFDSKGIYDKDGTWSKYVLTSAINSELHILNHLGHCNYTYAMKLSTSDLAASLHNEDYFFAYSQGCMPGGFDTYDCFAEVITTMEYGAFAVVMNARYGWGMPKSTDGPSQYYNREFWDAFLGEDIVNIGRMNQDSKEDSVHKINQDCMRWCYYELNLFGDPELAIHTDDKVSLYITYPVGRSYIAGTVYIVGTAYTEEEETFDGYQLYYAPKDDPDNKQPIGDLSSIRVQDDLLGEWDTTSCPDGEYILTLKLFTTERDFECFVNYVIVANVNRPPAIETWQITDLPGDENHPAIYEDKIVWMDPRIPGNSYDIYMYDLFTDEETAITNDVRLQDRPDIYGDKIVWYEYLGAYADIYMYDIATGTKEQITYAIYNQVHPAIYEDKIVWQDYRYGNSDIYICTTSLRTRKYG